jgi:glycerol-3-phosphate dehydrogenase
VFGGKLTTYRRLAEHAISELRPSLGISNREWTWGATLPGGDIPQGNFAAFAAEQARRYSYLPARLVRRWCRAYGTRIERVAGNAQAARDLGEEIVPELYEAELQFMRDHEWARTGEDALWRRSKLGLRYDPSQQARVAAWFG